MTMSPENRDAARGLEKVAKARKDAADKAVREKADAEKKARDAADKVKREQEEAARKAQEVAAEKNRLAALQKSLDGAELNLKGGRPAEAKKQLEALLKEKLSLEQKKQARDLLQEAEKALKAKEKK